MVTGLAWSPDSTRLVVAQSDCIVYVYKLGQDWGDKKSICNKFVLSAPATSCAWPLHSSNPYFGCAEGRVRKGVLRGNRAVTQYASESASPVLCMASFFNDLGFLVSHEDRAIVRVSVEIETQKGNSAPSIVRFFDHSVTATRITCGTHIATLGEDDRLVFYDDVSGAPVRTFDFSRGVEQFSDDAILRSLPPNHPLRQSPLRLCQIAFSPTGDVLAAGGKDVLLLFCATQKQTPPGVAAGFGVAATSPQWKLVSVLPLPGYGFVNSLQWKVGGNSLVLGTSSGILNMYSVLLKKTVCANNEWIFSYTSASCVIVSHRQHQMRSVLRSAACLPILNIGVLENRYVVARTESSCLIGDLQIGVLSEVPIALNSDGGLGSKKAFVFPQPHVCVLHREGEFHVIHLGSSVNYLPFRAEKLTKRTVSIVFPPESADIASGGTGPLLAYLLDARTVSVTSLASASPLAQITKELSFTKSFSSQIVELKLCEVAPLLLVKEKSGHLTLTNVQTKTSQTLLQNCSFFGWAPNKTVVIAQVDSTMYIWHYTSESAALTPEITLISGTLKDIQSSATGIEVLIENEQKQLSTYTVPSLSVDFSLLLSQKKYRDAAQLLANADSAQVNTAATAGTAIGAGAGAQVSTESLWNELWQTVLQTGELETLLFIAQLRGKYSNVQFLLNLMDEIRTQQMSPQDLYVRAQLQLLSGDVSNAEELLVQAGRINEAMQMLSSLSRPAEVVALAEVTGSPATEELRSSLETLYVSQRLFGKAAALRESQGDIPQAVEYYLSDKSPLRALRCILSHPSHLPLPVPDTLVIKVLQALRDAQLYEGSGRLLSRLGRSVDALEDFVKAKAWPHVVDTCRVHFPEKVVGYELEWARDLDARGLSEEAIEHYVEAGEGKAAVECALKHGLFYHAENILKQAFSGLEKSMAEYWVQVGDNYRKRGYYDQAEQVYAICEEGKHIVDMYLELEKWDMVDTATRKYLSVKDRQDILATAAKKFEARGKLQAAKILYTFLGDESSSIMISVREGDMVNAILQSEKSNPVLYRSLCLDHATNLESKQQLDQAEEYYLYAKEWKKAINMYIKAGLWNQALRLSHQYDTKANTTTLALEAWAAVGDQETIQLFSNADLFSLVLTQCIENGNWEDAKALCNKYNVNALPSVYSRYAAYLENKKDYAGAEKAHLSAGTPREAVLMYLYAMDFKNATRIAEEYDPPSLPMVLSAQAKQSADLGDWTQAEQLWIEAGKPEEAIEAYLLAGKSVEAMQIARTYAPHKLEWVKQKIHQGGMLLRPAAPGADSPATPPVPAFSTRRARDHPSPGAEVPLTSLGELESHVGAMMREAMRWKGIGDTEHAVQTLLELSFAGLEHEEEIVKEALQQAILWARVSFAPRDLIQTVRKVAAIYSAGMKWDEAGQLLNEYGLKDAAAIAFLQSKNILELQQLEHQVDQDTKEKIQSFLKARNITKKEDPVGLQLSHVLTQIEELLEDNDEKGALALASRQGPMVLAKYLFPILEEKLLQSDVDTVVTYLSTFGAPPLPSAYPLYELIAKHYFASFKEGEEVPLPRQERIRGEYYRLVANLRKYLTSPPPRYPLSGSEQELLPRTLPKYEELLMALHYSYLTHQHTFDGNKPYAALASLSLCRFLHLVPADYAFARVGTLARECAEKFQGTELAPGLPVPWSAKHWNNIAYACFNRVLDIQEALLDQQEPDSPALYAKIPLSQDIRSSAELANDDFEGTSFPEPGTWPLPSALYTSLTSGTLEKIRDWVLQFSLESTPANAFSDNVSISKIPMVPCMKCKAPCSITSLGCGACGTGFETCAITGILLLTRDSAKCKECGTTANMQPWRDFVNIHHVCAWCGTFTE